MIHEHAADAPLSRVAAFHGLHEHTVKQIDREALEKKIEQAPKGCATFIGVDEISHKKGHQYLSLITDLQGRRAISLQEGRKAESLARFFRYMGREHCADIKAVTVDRWKPYRKAIRKWCPRALVIFDKFHVIQDCNEAVDLVRRRLVRTLSADEKKQIKKSKWALLKRPERLSEPQRQRLAWIERCNRPLYRAYLLKEQFRHWYAAAPEMGQSNSVFLEQARQDFEAWCHRVMYSRIPELKRFVRGLRRDKQMVLNYFVHRLTNGLTEGLNSVIRQIQRRACGYRDMAYFTLKVYQKAGAIR
jgi:transposase